MDRDRAEINGNWRDREKAEAVRKRTDRRKERRTETERGQTDRDEPYCKLQ